eukprot:scaffold12161_cov81-Skeletonema_dohrnii-CCMP3373.AAC.4
MTCCSKVVCDGCCYVNKERELNPSLKRKCPFCRHPVPATEAEVDANIMKRVEANDPVATVYEGLTRYQEGDYGSAFDYLSNAAGRGDADAHYHLSHMYKKGEGIEKDEEMAVHHLEEAAIAGHPFARYNLGCHEWGNGKFERALKHFIIAANLGASNRWKF